MWLKWLPWKYLVKRTAASYGILDPLTLLAQIRRFAQPSENQEPIELIRAGIAFHARGLINTKAIQYNLDWIWPYWVEKQFNPKDPSFIPRAFSFSHVNLTHRDWTAVGLPDVPLYPIVDPRGLVTPIVDGWSLDFWIIAEDGRRLFPSRNADTHQQLVLKNHTVHTTCQREDRLLTTRVGMVFENGRPELNIDVEGSSNDGGWMVVGIRPYNPEGVQFVETIATVENKAGLLVNSASRVHMGEPAHKVLFSNYREGDVAHGLENPETERSIACDIGMATAAALYRIPDNRPKTLRIRVPMGRETNQKPKMAPRPTRNWSECLSGKSRLEIPNEKFQYLYDVSLRTLVMLSADDVVPGPYTYRRFWFRDACFMLNALLSAGFLDRSRSKLETFPSRQKHSGYFQSQEGEWDSNGQALWILHRFVALSGKSLSPRLVKAVLNGTRWILKKRTKETGDVPHSGLLPAGFSAEHLGPNDYYYWDNFWALAGLDSAVALLEPYVSNSLLTDIASEARHFEDRIFNSIHNIPSRKKRGAIPASCYRRMDAGAVGSLVADYPLQITPPGDGRVMGTVDYLMNNCFHHGAFFQDMIHSGVNAYLTLSIAQTLLRAGDPRYRQLIDAVADLASPTGNWPEAIHPHSGGGCMGDGQHGWAAAEWHMIVRNLFVREEGSKILLGTGIFPEWLSGNRRVRFGPTWTNRGKISLAAQKVGQHLHLDIDTEPLAGAFDLNIEVPGYQTKQVRSQTETLKIRLGET